ncbi:short-chain dehydrogenase/reductase SDR [Spirochaeta thermophila DSM 6578]|uniref:Short-chain dehydrogenase/reductase SDR n=1 Tax=Winmispira thermophila (strain ATCC 700085 / DSM 6578 / Z-1203) TaxID=869211 RepID=G0GBZ8_WINT7|nr:SDR family NAD(P)-dependent oxidoreductase [Spirochaeta thermophila]AEJ62009.1 short-chain dehydrogenase/reductase SDR [Spirochaeta thermophila DSM 6578]
MKLDLSNKTALVTGAGVGIGAGIAKALAECGAKVAITYYSHREDAEKTASDIRAKGGEVYVFQLDATKSDEVAKVVKDVAEVLGGRIDILVNNAGHLIGRVNVAEMSDEHWHKVIHTNLSSNFYVTRAALPFIPEGGRIVNMASLAARNGGGNGAVAYAAAKAGILGFTRGLAKELAPRNITVNALAPGFIVDTPFHETFTGREKYEDIIQRIPLKRAGTPRDVAGAVLYFVSDLGSWVTGQVAEINGGSWFV